ncbi:hypothetical protein GOBAR_AA03147 [Gossypium barbadense]|uniref:DUF4283 domain-containing protein n=1 Tax=Gossypium barbadense TaxID=3634 RepID=A0A2P5YP96_GOSBA|nr:hypothetical protein GOBAR_AA03147 [Gossypium barbadense]
MEKERGFDELEIQLETAKGGLERATKFTLVGRIHANKTPNRRGFKWVLQSIWSEAELEKKWAVNRKIQELDFTKEWVKVREKGRQEISFHKKGKEGLSGEGIEGVESDVYSEERLLGKMVGNDGRKVVRVGLNPYFVELSSNEGEKCEMDSVETSAQREKQILVAKEILGEKVQGMSLDRSLEDDD